MGTKKAGKLVGNTIIFSENGKDFYSVFDGDGICDENIFVWSPDHKYVFWISSGWNCDAPQLKDGVWHHDARLYDPAKRILFDWPSLPSNPEYYNVLGVNWVKGTEHDILIKFPDQAQGWKNVKETISTEEWEKTSDRANIRPYLNWLASGVVSAIKKDRIDSLRSLTKDLPGKGVNDDGIELLKQNCGPEKVNKLIINNNRGSYYKDALGVDITAVVNQKDFTYFCFISIFAKDNYPFPPEIIDVKVGMESGN